MSRPWMPLYIGDFVSGTWHMRAEEVGAFALLLMHRHSHGSLPDDDAALAQIVRLRQAKWLDIKATVLALFEPKRSGNVWADEIVGIGRRDSRPAIPIDIRRAVIARDGLACVYCGDAEGPFDLDHKTPWSRGGRHTIENLCVACVSCNRSKGACTAEEWTK